MARNTSSEFDYKQRPFSRSISQSEWDAIFSHPAADRQADSPRSTSSQPQPERDGRNTVDGLGLRASSFDGDMGRVLTEIQVRNALENHIARAYATREDFRGRA